MSGETYVGTFGYKCAWFAVRSSDPGAVAGCFGKTVSAVSWSDGCSAAYGGRAFVTQSLGDWVLVAGTSLQELVGWKRPADLVGRLQALSARFGEAQYFATDRVIGLVGYGRARDGEVVRAWAAVDGDRFLDHGEVTDEERQLGIGPKPEPDDDEDDEDDEDEDDDHFVAASETSLMELAGRWSIDPQTLAYGEKTGFVVD